MKLNNLLGLQMQCTSEHYKKIHQAKPRSAVLTKASKYFINIMVRVIHKHVQNLRKLEGH